MRNVTKAAATTGLLLLVLPVPGTAAEPAATPSPPEYTEAAKVFDGAGAAAKQGNDSLAMEQFRRAGTAFEAFASGNQASPFAPPALFFAGVSWDKGGEPRRAIANLEALLAAYPNSKASQRGTGFLAEKLAAVKDYRAAEKRGIEYVTRWPSGEHHCTVLTNLIAAQVKLAKPDALALSWQALLGDAGCAQSHREVIARLLDDTTRFESRMAVEQRRRYLEARVAFEGAGKPVSKVSHPVKSDAEERLENLKKVGGEVLTSQTAQSTYEALEGVWETQDRWVPVLRGDVIAANGWEEDSRTPLQLQTLKNSQRYREAEEYLAQEKKSLLGQRAYVVIPSVRVPPYDLKTGAFVISEKMTHYGGDSPTYGDGAYGYLEGSLQRVSLAPAVRSRPASSRARECAFENFLTVVTSPENALKAEKAGTPLSRSWGFGIVNIVVVYRVQGVADVRAIDTDGVCETSRFPVIQGVAEEIIVEDGGAILFRSPVPAAKEQSAKQRN